MHMADALVSPEVGGVMWAATAATTVYCARRVHKDLDESRIPLMGVAGAFIFAAQMLNFTIPGTGSSGHLGGGLILAILLGPEAAFLVMASILTVQALFFADGGLLALGCNVFNLGFFPAFVAYPLIYRKIVGDRRSRRRIVIGSMIAALVGLQLGALGVVLETRVSGISALPFSTFVAVMLPIHLAIGVVEGLVTSAVVLFVLRAQPELLARNAARSPLRGLRLKPVLIGLAVAALVAGGALSWFASTNPDGLEWAIARVTGSGDPESSSQVHDTSADVQDRTAFLRDFGFWRGEPAAEGETSTGLEGANARQDGAGAGRDESRWPAVDPGTSVAGIVGALIVLGVAVAIGLVLKRRSAARSGANV